jgi:hypothetical protein
MLLHFLRTNLLKNKACRLFFIVLLCNYFTSRGQNTSNNAIPLQEILQQLEKKHEIRFSYNVEAVKSVRIQNFDMETSLENSLAYLSRNYPLSFTTIENRYIAVQVTNFKYIDICGVVIDTQTGTPLDGADIISESRLTSTDSGGKFKLMNIPENELLRVYYLGFPVKTFIARELQGGTECPLLFIDPGLNYLPTVVLDSYMTKGISKNAEGSVTISNSNFEILPSLIEPDVLQIAQVLPGIESFDETASNINVRGGKSDEVLLLWDDIRMYQSGHFFGLISAFNPNLTRDVTIYKNGTHPRFGESVSGVISMKSDENIPQQVTGGVGINLISTSGYAKIPASEDLSFTVSGRTSINSTLGNPVYNQFFNRVFQNTIITNLQSNTSQGLRSTDEDFNFYDISIKGIWELSEKDKIQYNFLTINNKLNFTERFVSENISTANVSELKQRNTVNGFSWRRDWTKNLSSKFLIHGAKYVLSEEDLELNTQEFVSQRNQVTESGFKADIHARLSSQILLNAGFHYSDTEILDTEASNTSTVIERERTTMISNTYYMNGTLKLFDKRTILTTGLRLTHFPSLSESFAEPRFNLYQKINDSFSLNVSGELKSQSVFQFIDVNNKLLGVENKRWTLANGLDIPVLQSKQISLGATYTYKGWTLNGEGFYKKVSGISASNQGFRNQFQNAVAVGDYEVNGAELSITKQAEKLTFLWSYTFMNNDYTFMDLSPSQFPNALDVSHAMNLAATFSYRSFQFSLGSTFRSGVPYTQPVAGNEIVFENGVPRINFGAPNAHVLRSYFRTDFSALYEFKVDETFSGRINLAFLNIFDRENALDTYYRLETDEENNASINRIDQFSLGFTPNISFRLLF